MKKAGLLVCLLAALALAWLTVPFPPAVDITAEAAVAEIPKQQIGIRCEVECEDGNDGGLLFCAHPTWEECCAVAERICADNGGLAFGGCYNNVIGVTCDNLPPGGGPFPF